MMNLRRPRLGTALAAKTGKIKTLTTTRMVIIILSMALVIFIETSGIILEIQNNDDGPAKFSYEHDEKNPIAIKSDFINNHYGAPEIWNDICIEGAKLHQQALDSSNDSLKLVVIEVGANSLNDALKAAKLNLTVLSIEPSPISYKNMVTRAAGQRSDIRSNIFIYNAAVGDSIHGNLNFLNSGSTGAQVISDADAAKLNPKDFVQVKTVTVDQILHGEVTPDFIYHDEVSKLQHSLLHRGTNERIFAAKIDVQGFEPKVFQGMKKLIQNRKIDIILTEFWPRGINTMNGYPQNCDEAIQYLLLMSNAGYTFYATHFQSHPKEEGYKQMLKYGYRKGAPFHDLKLHCLEMYKLERLFPEPDGHNPIGKWTDYLAVSPDVSLAPIATTRLGSAIEKLTKEQHVPDTI